MEHLTRIAGGLAARIRFLGLKLRGVRLAGFSRIGRIDLPRFADRVEIGAGTALERGVTLLVSDPAGSGPAVRIGPRCYVNRGTMLDASLSIEIGADTMIGPGCYITDHDHLRGADGRPGSGTLVSKPVRIGERCWIGAHAVILKGVTLGDGATVGAGAVVTHDVPPGVTVAGNPAAPLVPKNRPA